MKPLDFTKPIRECSSKEPRFLTKALIPVNGMSGYIVQDKHGRFCAFIYERDPNKGYENVPPEPIRKKMEVWWNPSKINQSPSYAQFFQPNPPWTQDSVLLQNHLNKGWQKVEIELVEKINE